MRVVAGKWRGRVLRSPRGLAVRPTTDRVKEAMFSILGPPLAGSVFVDLCCGAGGLAVEALSRGASRVILVDSSRPSLELARANLELCGAAAGSYQLVRADVLVWLGQWEPPAGPWHLVADPPYQSELPWTILEQLTRLSARPGFRLGLVEHGAAGRGGSGPGQALAAGLEIRRYGKSALVVVRPAAVRQGEDT